MGVNMGNIRKRREEEEKKEAARSMGVARIWKPKQGKNNIRILPPWSDSGDNADSFAREVYTHWSVGEGDKRRSFTCPQLTPGLDGDCPICIEIARLRSTTDTMDMEVADEIRGKQGFLSNAINLDDPVFTKEDYDTAAIGGTEPSFNIGDTKIQVFTYGPMIYKQLIDSFDLLNKDLTDMTTGRDLIINRSGKGKTGTKYTVIVGPNDSVCTFSGGVEVYDLDAMYPQRTTAEMKQALGGSSEPQALPPPVAQALPPSQTPVVPSAEVTPLEQHMIDALKGA